MRSVTDHHKDTARTKMRLAVVVAALGAALLLSACGGAKQPATVTTQAPVATAEVASPPSHLAAAPADDHAEHAEPVHVHDDSHTLPAQPLAALSGDSLYHLKSAWTDQHQMPVTLPELAGG